MTVRTPNATRRGFLMGSGALSFALLTTGGVAVLPSAAGAQPLLDGKVNAWVTITPDNRVTIKFGSAEMGQGVSTSLPMIAAEELDADWSRVTSEQVSTDPEGVYGNAMAGGILFAAGSSSIEGYFTYLRQAGAQARQILIQIAAAHWGVPAEEVTTRRGMLHHDPSGSSMTYGDLGTNGYATGGDEVAALDRKRLHFDRRLAPSENGLGTGARRSAVEPERHKIGTIAAGRAPHLGTI